ncbi:MAG: SDR family oxidoreductase [Anaerolineales bacterium]|nr:SDR family oxidoreductase [Anaerolineales bacterium]MCS7247750.1 SDR family oxidoreductase [Anaerolineales bacterium]MDW8161560.1 SDR family oxidoreductase [Anaerolineales bacterium]MDW8446954.1 SDR family oxidoreductase [Anaerolineales bacterium]
MQVQNVLITGAGRRIGRELALAAAQAGANVALHYYTSAEGAEQTAQEIRSLGREATTLCADLTQTRELSNLIKQAERELGPLTALVNNAAIFEPLDWESTTLSEWERHLRLNLTAPFLLSQAFARRLTPGASGRIINILDWRALRPGADYLPYTISKAALAALTRSLAQALAPHITVNGLALGAILPPAEPNANKNPSVLANLPIPRWASMDEVTAAFVFLLCGPTYITGEILHVDGGRHLV